MPPTVIGTLFVLAGYLLGSVSFGLLAAKRAGAELRHSGSGNIGATNVGRVLGKRTGRIVLLLDALKGFVPVLGARIVLGPDDGFTAATGVAAVLGHLAPLWHDFRGGKGAATSAGVLLAAVPWAGVAGALGYVVGKKATRRASVGSLLGSAAGVVVTVAVVGPVGPRPVMAYALLVLVVIRHAGNIGRLVRGVEPPS
jgi:glycerol-3-phosphate acyltransferase PlsY